MSNRKPLASARVHSRTRTSMRKRQGNPRTNLAENPATWAQPTPDQDTMRHGEISAGARAGRGQPRRYRVDVRPAERYANTLVEDLDQRGHVQRMMGQREGRWETVALFIDKQDAHVESDRLVGDSAPAREALNGLGTPRQASPLRFVATPRGGATGDRPTATDAQRQTTEGGIQAEQGRGQRK